MKALFFKELRLLAPAFWMALLMGGIALLTVSIRDHSVRGMGMLCLVIGQLLLALSSMGKEISLGTLSQGMTLPVRRSEWWGIKTTALTLAMGTIWLLVALSAALLKPRYGLSHFQVFSGFSTLVFLTGAPMFLLLFRNGFAAFWFSILIPGFLLTWSLYLETHFPHWERDDLFTLFLCGYSAVALLAGRRMFLRWQDREYSSVPVQNQLKSLFFRKAVSTVAAQRNWQPWRAQLGKEFHVQLASLCLFLFAAVCTALSMVYRSQSHNPYHDVLDVLISFVWIGIPVVAGASSVAVERGWGTFQDQLCLPFRRRTLYFIKLSSVTLVSILLAALPVYLFLKAGWTDPRVAVKSSFEVVPPDLAFSALFALVLGWTSFHASTFSRHGLQSLTHGVLLLIPILWMFHGIYGGVIHDWVVGQAFGEWTGDWYGYLILGTVGISVFFAGMIWFGFCLMRRLLEGRQIFLKSLGRLALLALLIEGLSLTVYHRAWELLGSMAPTPSGPRLIGSVEPKIEWTYSGRLWALLPDGRLWCSKPYLWEEIFSEQNLVEVPRWEHIGGDFFIEGRFRDFVVGDKDIFAIRENGRLCQMMQWRRDASESASSKTRVGRWEWIMKDVETYQNWTSVDWVYWSHNYIGVQADGSLWKWAMTQEEDGINPERIRPELDWKRVRNQLAFTKDGRCWKPTWISISTQGVEATTNNLARDFTMEEIHSTDTIPTANPEDSWKDLQAPYRIHSIYFGITESGELWRLRRLPDADTMSRIHPIPIKWISLDSDPEFLTALAEDGTLVFWDKGSAPSPEDRRWTRPTRYPLASFYLPDAPTHRP